MSWIDIGSVTDIPLRGARLVKTSAGCVAVFRTAEQEVYAATNTCPHKGGPLTDGIVHDNKVTCPLHNWVFDLTTGEAVGEDARITTYPIRIDAGRLLLDISALPKRSAA